MKTSSAKNCLRRLASVALGLFVLAGGLTSCASSSQRREVIVSVADQKMALREDGKTVRAMDVLVPRIGEIIGGSQREDRLDTLLARMTAAGLRQEDYWWYIDLRKFGSVPHAGFGLGLERAVQYVTGMANIRDVIPFPRTPGNAEF